MSQTVEMCAGAKWQQVEHDPIDGKCISQNQISVFILEKALWRLKLYFLKYLRYDASAAYKLDYLYNSAQKWDKGNLSWASTGFFMFFLRQHVLETQHLFVYSCPFPKQVVIDYV